MPLFCLPPLLLLLLLLLLLHHHHRLLLTLLLLLWPRRCTDIAEVDKAVLALCWLDPDLRATVDQLDSEIGRQVVGIFFRINSYKFKVNSFILS